MRPDEIRWKQRAAYLLPVRQPAPKSDMEAQMTKRWLSALLVALGLAVLLGLPSPVPKAEVVKVKVAGW